MPTLTIKTEYVERLKQLGVYDQWLTNVKKQWGSNATCNPVKMKSGGFKEVILWSFSWRGAVEGHKFWRDISGK